MEEFNMDCEKLSVEHSKNATVIKLCTLAVSPPGKYTWAIQ